MLRKRILTSIFFMISSMAGQLHSEPGISLKSTATDFTGVAKKAVPAVVSIKIKESTYSKLDDTDEENPFGELGGRLWKRFFGSQLGENAPQREGQGSGFIVSNDGYIITNGHVVSHTNSIKVRLHDEREFLAKLVGIDRNTDIALIKIDAKDLPYVKLGNSDQLEVGQWVVAIGTPLGLEATLSAGIVSAKGRNNLDLARVEDFIQTDASLYHGNSGGPLLNLNGEVIGINTAIASRMGGYIGIGFAIPSNIAKNVMDQLVSKGSISRGFIGVVLQEVDSNQATAFGLPNAQGVLIARVTEASPAEKSGVRQGDIITAYNDLPIHNVGALRTAIAMMSPGSQLKLAYVRDGKPLEVTLIVGEYAPKESIE